jgi:biopolymer transport protein ExbB
MEQFSLIQLFTRFAMLGAEWVMWLLLGLSFFSISVLIERLLYFRSLNDDLDSLADKVNNKLQDGDEDEARNLLKKSPSAAALVALAGLDDPRGPHAVERTMASALARVKPALDRNLNILGTIGSTSPFIGLLGTVIGIIQAFDALKTPEGMGGAAAAAAAAAATGKVMGTIAEALVATAIGLGVAIPAVVAFNYLNRKIKLILGSTEVLSQIVMAHAYGVEEGHTFNPPPRRAEREEKAPANVGKPSEVMG